MAEPALHPASLNRRWLSFFGRQLTFETGCKLAAAAHMGSAEVTKMGILRQLGVATRTEGHQRPIKRRVIIRERPFWRPVVTHIIQQVLSAFPAMPRVLTRLASVGICGIFLRNDWQILFSSSKLILQARAGRPLVLPVKVAERWPSG